MLRRSCLGWGMGAVLAVLGTMGGAREARACGACVHEPPPPNQTVSTVVTDHRMVFSVSPTQTVLWDQIRYAGSASSFAWVLPVKPGAQIQLSQDSWIAALDATTQTVIQGPAEYCGGGPSTQDVSGGGFGCGSSSASASAFGTAADAGAGAGGPPPVTVVSQQVVGPYDAVTVRSSQGEALTSWLQTNGYEVPASLQTTIDAFTNSGFDFIALKLAPGEGVQAMQPVRVISPGADLTLPLRMVAGGVGASVGIELFVIGEGRYHTQNFPDATIDFSKLAWDPIQDLSNYTTLAAAALVQNGASGWLTEMSGPIDGYNAGGNPTLSAAYAQSCQPMLVPMGMGCTPLADAGGVGDAGDAGGFTCGPTMIACDDLDLALSGTSGNVWVTRLRATLPVSALAADLILEATAQQTPVPSFHQTSAYTVPNYNPCGNGASSGKSSSGACAAAPSRSRTADLVGGVLGVAVLASIARRRVRRGR